MGLTLTLAAVAAGCSGGSPETGMPEPAPPVSVTDAQIETLNVSEQSPARLSGTYTRGNVTLRFDARVEAHSTDLVLLRADDSEVLHVRQGSDGITLSVLGKYSFVTDALLVQKLRNGMAAETDMPAGATFEGDPETLAELEQTPEYASIPLLSRRLGALGINGRDYPSSLGLHLLGKRAAGRLKMVFPAATAASDANAPTNGADAASTPAQPSTDSPGALKTKDYDIFNCQTQPDGSTCCLQAGRGGATYTCGNFPLPGTPAASCEQRYPYPDLRCDPNHDQCFGMCGNDCSCWEAICGDCNYHWQCAQHDWICKQGEDAAYWNPMKYVYLSGCYSWDAIVAEASCAPVAVDNGVNGVTQTVSGFTSAAPPSQVAWYRDTSTMFDGQADWAPGYGKADCAPGWRLNGLASWANVDEAALCVEGDTNVFSGLLLEQIDYAGYDQRRASRSVAGSTDWDYGYVKHECAVGQYVSAIAEGSMTVIGNYDFLAIQCSLGGQVTSSVCETRTLADADDRATVVQGDWDYGAIKAECAADQYVAGVSVDGAGQVHRLLCCNIH